MSVEIYMVHYEERGREVFDTHRIDWQVLAGIAKKPKFTKK